MLTNHILDVRSSTQTKLPNVPCEESKEFNTSENLNEREYSGLNRGFDKEFRDSHLRGLHPEIVELDEEDD